MTQPEDASRSGADVAAAVDRAAAGTPHGGVLTPPADAEPHAAPVEQVRDDPAMTQGQVVDGPGTTSTGPGPAPAPGGSGGAQSQQGARVSDRAAADGPAEG